MTDLNHVVIMAHRGVTLKGLPENSMPAFQAVIDEGYNGVELDVRTSRDRRLFVFHDMKLENLTAGGRGLVRTKSSRILKTLKLKADDRCKIPLLEDVLDLFRPHNNILVNIEIKSESPVRGRIESGVLKLIREFKMEHRTVVSSFNPLVLKTIRRLDKKIQTGFIFEKRLPKFHLKLAKSLPVNSWHPNFRVVNELLIEESRRDNKTIMPWTINRPADIKKMLGLGVQFIITDRPDRVKSAVEKMKKNEDPKA